MRNIFCCCWMEKFFILFFSFLFLYFYIIEEKKKEKEKHNWKISMKWAREWRPIDKYLIKQYYYSEIVRHLFFLLKSIFRSSFISFTYFHHFFHWCIIFYTSYTGEYSVLTILWRPRNIFCLLRVKTHGMPFWCLLYVMDV